MFSSLVAGAKFVEAERSRTEVSAFVETALVAHDLARVESGATPGRGFCCVAIEAATTEILGLL